jgi:membrane-bound metal-dependent hydrolase YbcI (DUF457 family)
VDNLAHTLVGAALGRVVGGRRLPAAGWVGAVAANAPDWAEFFLGLPPGRRGVAYYELHRGITHSVLGAAVETVALAGVVWLAILATRARRRHTDGARPAILPVTVVSLVGLAVLSHLYMDWQGSYGVRPWLPWSDRWYYADWVAIVDPLFWLLPLVGLAWGAERHWRDLVPIALGFGFVLWAEFAWRPDLVAGWVRGVSVALALAAGVGWTRYWYGPVARRRAAGLSLAALALYVAGHVVLSIPAKAAARDSARARFGPSAQWAALTRIGRPFTWESVSASPDTVAGPGWAVPRHLDLPAVRRALTSSEGRILAGFARFLTAAVDSGPRGRTVTLRDARYARPPAHGWGTVTVEVSDR